MVSDTGPGIADKDLPHIYEQGFSTKASKGRGMGMALIKRIVDGHAGTIEVETEPGFGTTFTIILNQTRGGIV
jgi:signal transduction histidine kinase